MSLTPDLGSKSRLADGPIGDPLSARTGRWWGCLDVRGPHYSKGRVVANTGYRTRAGDYETSTEGATDVAYRASNQQIQLLRQYRRASERGYTDEEAGRAADLLGSCYWKRCGELRFRGLITRPPDQRVRMASAGVRRIVCVITEDGLELLRQLQLAALADIPRQR